MNSTLNFSQENMFLICSEKINFFTHLAVELGSDLEPCLIGPVSEKSRKYNNSDPWATKNGFQSGFPFLTS